MITPDTKKKKILIVSMTGGFGHIRAGEALLDYARQYLPKVDAEHINIADFNPLFKEFNVKFYDVASKKIPFVWGLLYKASDFRSTSFVLKKIAGMDPFFSRRIERHLSQKNPDGIIFTNVVPLALFSSGFRKKFPNTTLGIVATDYHGHPYYHFSWLDYYFVANDKVKDDLEKVGIDKEKIIITGIPVNPRFYIKENIGKLKLKYGIKNDFPIVLLVASFKISKKDLVKTIKRLLQLEPEINLIVIANGNEEFHFLLEKNFAGHERLWLVKWTQVIEEYMKMSDVIISKAGGLTVSECLCLQKPLIMVNPIPGQEEHNAEFVEQNNFGKKVKKLEEIFELLPKMISSAKKNEESFAPRENPSEKIFTYYVGN